MYQKDILSPSLIYAALIVTWGRVGDQIGRKRIFIIGAILTTQISASATTQFKAAKDIPVPLQSFIIQGIANSGGSDSGPAASGMPTGAQNSPLGKEIGGIIQQSFVDGSRAAARTASVFVLLGAISSLLIPNSTHSKARVVMVSE